MSPSKQQPGAGFGLKRKMQSNRVRVASRAIASEDLASQRMKELQEKRQQEVKQSHEKMLMEQEDHVSKILSNYWYKRDQTPKKGVDEDDDAFFGSALRQQVRERREAEEKHRRRMSELQKAPQPSMEQLAAADQGKNTPTGNADGSQTQSLTNQSPPTLSINPESAPMAISPQKSPLNSDPKQIEGVHDSALSRYQQNLKVVQEQENEREQKHSSWNAGPVSAAVPAQSQQQPPQQVPPQQAPPQAVEPAVSSSAPPSVAISAASATAATAGGKPQAPPIMAPTPAPVQAPAPQELMQQLTDRYEERLAQKKASKTRIKMWVSGFRKQNGREPGVQDKMDNQHLYAEYKEHDAALAVLKKKLAAAPAAPVPGRPPQMPQGMVQSAGAAVGNGAQAARLKGSLGIDPSSAASSHNILAAARAQRAAAEKAAIAPPAGPAPPAGGPARTAGGGGGGGGSPGNTPIAPMGIAPPPIKPAPPPPMAEEALKDPKDMSYNDVSAEYEACTALKKESKAMIKEWAERFVRKYGRDPTSADKAEIKDLYVKYKSSTVRSTELKKRLDELEVEEQELLAECMDPEFSTSAHAAAYKGQFKCLEYLIQNYEVWPGGDHEGRSPLFYAAVSDQHECVEMLLNNGGEAHIDAQDTKGDSPLHAAAANGCTKSVEVLLKHSANHNLQNWEGFAPAHIAYSREILMSLHISGADLVKIKDSSGRSPLFHACHSGYEEVKLTPFMFPLSFCPFPIYSHATPLTYLLFFLLSSSPACQLFDRD
jgi:hypothetical protein